MYRLTSYSARARILVSLFFPLSPLAVANVRATIFLILAKVFIPTPSPRAGEGFARKKKKPRQRWCLRKACTRRKTAREGFYVFFPALRRRRDSPYHRVRCNAHSALKSMLSFLGETVLAVIYTHTHIHCCSLYGLSRRIPCPISSFKLFGRRATARKNVKYTRNTVLLFLYYIYIYNVRVDKIRFYSSI